MRAHTNIRILQTKTITMERVVRIAEEDAEPLIEFPELHENLLERLMASKARLVHAGDPCWEVQPAGDEASTSPETGN